MKSSSTEYRTRFSAHARFMERTPFTSSTAARVIEYITAWPNLGPTPQWTRHSPDTGPLCALQHVLRLTSGSHSPRGHHDNATKQNPAHQLNHIYDSKRQNYTAHNILLFLATSKILKNILWDKEICLSNSTISLYFNWMLLTINPKRHNAHHYTTTSQELVKYATFFQPLSKLNSFYRC